jgi:hypothetical protein
VQTRRANLAILLVNSSFGFALGMAMAFLVYQAGLVAAGLLFDREPLWFVDRVEFAAGGSDAAWSGGILLVLAVGWALAGIYRGGSRYDGTRLAVLWVALHLFRQGLLPLLRLAFDEESDAALALAASSLPESLTVVLAVLGAAGLLAVGWLAAPALLRFAPENLSTKMGRIAFIGLIGIAAWIIGTLLALPLLVPGGEIAPWGLVPWGGAFLLFTLVASPEPRQIYATREPAFLAWGTLIVLAVFIAAARLILGDGLSITIS